MAQPQSTLRRLAVRSLIPLFALLPLVATPVFGQSASNAFQGGVFPIHSSANSQRWFGIVIDRGANNSLVGLRLSGGATGGPLNPSNWLIDLSTGQQPRPFDDLDGVAVASLGGTTAVYTIGPFTGRGFLFNHPLFPPLPHQDWCMGNFFQGSGISFRFNVWIRDSNGGLISGWAGNSHGAGTYSAHDDDEDVLEWFASPAAGVDPLEVAPNSLQLDNDNGSGDSTYTFRVQYANGRTPSTNDLPPRWGWAAGTTPGDGRTRIVNFDRLPKRAPDGVLDAGYADSFSFNGLSSGNYGWTIDWSDDAWMDHSGDYVGLQRTKGAGDATYPEYEKRVQAEVVLIIDGNIQRPHFMLREDLNDNTFRDFGGAIYKYVIQPTDYMNFLDNMFQLRYDPPGPDDQDLRARGVRGTPASNGYVSLPPGPHTYEFAATDDFFPPRGVAHVQIGWPGNQTRVEYWNPMPEPPSSPSAHRSWERRAPSYTREVRPFGYAYDAQDATQYPNVNPVLSGFPYFNPAVRPQATPPPYHTGVQFPEGGVAPFTPVGGEPRLVPVITHELFDFTAKTYGSFPIISPFEGVSADGGPDGSNPFIAGRPGQPTHYINDDTIRPNFANIWPESPADPSAVALRGGKWTESTTFTFLTNYWRMPNRSPDFIRVMVRRNDNGTSPTTWRGFTMNQLVPGDTDYTDGAVFQFQITADQLPGGGGPGDYNYYFVASDGARSTIFPNRPPTWTEFETNDTFQDVDPLLPLTNPQADFGVAMDPTGANDWYAFRVNTPPVLTNSSVTPGSDREGSDFMFSVTYTDTDGEVLNTNALGDEPFDASIYVDLFGDPEGDNNVSGVTAGSLTYTTQTGTGYGVSELVDAVRPYLLRIEDAASGSAIGLTYQITANTATSITATPLGTALGLGADPIGPGDRFELLQWFQGTMSRQNPADARANDGIVYTFNTANLLTLGPGLHRYYFEFRDDWADWAYPNDSNVSVEGERVRFPMTSEFEGPEVLRNTAPTLSNFRFNPDAPGAGADGTTATLFKLVFTYTDQENDPPSVIRAGIDGTSSAPDIVLDMTQSDPNDTVYSDGSVFETTGIRLAAGTHIFRGQTRDGELNFPPLPPAALPADPQLFSGPTPVSPYTTDVDLGSVDGPLVAQNTPPMLVFETTDAPPAAASPGLDPDSGTEQDTYTYTIIYEDADVFAGVQGNPPEWVRVYIDGVANDMTKVDPSDGDYTDGATFQHQVTGLVAGTAHSYYFRASDGLDSARQPELTATPNKFAGPRVDQPPGEPKSLVVADVPNDQGGATQGSFNPSNDDGGGANDVTEYRLYYDTAPGTSTGLTNPTLATTIPATGAGAYSFTHDTAPKVTDLWYDVRAWDGTNESIASNVAGPVNATDNVAPDAPTNLAITDPGLGNQLDASWTKSADDPNAGANDVTEYRLYWSLLSGQYTTALATLPSGTTTYNDNTPVDGVDNFYVVRAWDGENESANSNEAGPVQSSDASPPVLANFSPAPNDRDVPVDTPVEFEATDSGAGVDLSTRDWKIEVGGRDIFPDGNFSTPAPITNGFKFSWTPKDPFNELDIVTVTITIADRAVPLARSVTKTYRFTVTPPPTYKVSGTILTDDGTGTGTLVGLAGVRVFVGVLSGVSDATGQYTVTGLTNGSFEVRPQLRGKAFLPPAKNVTIADAHVLAVDFLTVPAYDTAGRVTDAATGNGTANVRVSNGITDVMTDANGDYVIEDSPAGNYLVRPQSAGFVFNPAQAAVMLPVPGAGSATGVDFTIAPETFTVSGTVSTSEGGRLSGAKVIASSGGGEVANATTDIGGGYSIAGLLAGTYQITVERAGFTFEPTSLSATVGPNSSDKDFVAFELFTVTYPAGISFAAVPVNPASDDAIVGFGTDRFARWDPDSAAADKYAFAALDPTNPVLDLGPGRGFFVAYTVPTLVNIPGRLVRRTDQFQMNLRDGFNMQGNPYPADLPWSNIAISATGPVADFGFVLLPGATTYELVSDVPGLGGRSSIPEGAGVWMNSDTATSVTINGPGVASVASAAPAATVDARNWIVPVTAYSPSAADISSRAGVMEATADRPAGIRVLNPPWVQGTVDVYFTADDGTRLGCDVRAQAAATTAWPFAVWTDLQNTPVTVSLPDLTQVPAGSRVTLVDVASGKRHYARTMAGLTYNSREGGERKFVLEISPETGGQLAISAASAQQTGVGVEITYALSARATVAATVRNVAGREVATITTGSDVEAGRNSVVWNLQSASGTKVPGGRYIIELNAVTDDGQRASAIQSVSVTR